MVLEQDTSPKQGKPFVPPLNMAKVENVMKVVQQQQQAQIDVNGFQGEVILNEMGTTQSIIR